MLNSLNVLPATGKTLHQFPFVHSGRVAASAEFAGTDLRRSASINPDSLIPSRIADLMSKYVIQSPIAVETIETETKKIICRANSARIVCMSMAFPPVDVAKHSASVQVAA